MKLNKISIGLIILLLTFFMFFSTSFFYGEYAPSVEKIYIWYLIFAIGIVAFIGKTFPTFKQNPKEFANFAIFFVITLPVALGFSYLLNLKSSIETIMLIMGFGFLHAFVKAYIEEGVFRGILMRTPLGFWGQAGVFGLFHFAMLSMTAGVLVSAGTLAAASVPIFVISNALLLTLLGAVWGLVYLRYGLMASTGSHFAWNTVAYGIITASMLTGGSL